MWEILRLSEKVQCETPRQSWPNAHWRQPGPETECRHELQSKGSEVLYLLDFCASVIVHLQVVKKTYYICKYSLKIKEIYLSLYMDFNV